MLQWWLDAVFASECFDKVFVNMHYLSDQVSKWIDAYSKRTSRKILKIDETDTLLGTAGTLFYHAEPGEDFMTAYTDTFSADFFATIPRIMAAWTRESSSLIGQIMTAGVVSFTPEDNSATGNMLVDQDRVVYDFLEKGGSGKMAWAGVIFAKAEMLDEIKATDKDIARDVLPRLCGRMRLLAHVNAYDIGRGVEHYERFKSQFKEQPIR